MCHNPEMHLLVYFLDRGELRVVLPSKYRDTVKTFSSHYNRYKVAFYLLCILHVSEFSMICLLHASVDFMSMSPTLAIV